MSSEKPRFLRILTALCVLLAAFAVQYYVANTRLPVEAEDIGELSPATARLGRHLLTIEQPELHPTGLLLSYSGTGREVIDATFESARYDDRALRELGFDPPAGAHPVSYLAHDTGQPEAAGEPCRTSLEVYVAPGSRPASRIAFSQTGSPGLDRFRQLRLDAAESHLTVRLMTASADGNPFHPLCSRLLRIGEFEAVLQGSQAVRIAAEPGSAIELRLGRGTDGSALWGGDAGFVGGFILSESPPLRAAGLRVERRSEGARSAAALHAAWRPEGEPALSIDRLQVGSDQVQISVAGKAWTTIDGSDVTVNLFDRLKRYPLFAGLFGTANAGLVAWLVGTFRRKKQ